MHKEFSFLEKRYGNPLVYLFETNLKLSCIIAIPSWNWSFCIEYAFPYDVVRGEMVKALSVPMFLDDAEVFADQLYEFILNDMK